MADQPKKGKPKKLNPNQATPERMKELAAKAAAAPYKLNERQRLFAREYLVDLNGRQAAIRAGYADDNASKVATRLLKNKEVRAIIDQAIEKRNARLAIKQERVLDELTKIAFADLTDFVTGSGSPKDLDELPLGEGSVISEISKNHTMHGTNSKVKLHDKLKALELLGRHLGMRFGKDKNEDSDIGCVKIDLSGLR